MTYGPCCPGKTATKKIRVGDQEIGISGLDEILKKGLAAEGGSDEELRRVLLKELKIYNYIPSAVEHEYLEAIWREFLKERESRMRRW